MRGTARRTNKALLEPILVMGAERNLFIMNAFFWISALISVLPHWPSFLVITGLVVNIYFLRFMAKRDPKGVAAFRSNSRFLVQHRFYVAHGFAGNLRKARKVRTVPLRLLARL